MTKNTKNWLAAIVTTLLAFFSGQAFAAKATGPGLPQLDIATWPSQVFWLVVLFGLGYLVMAKMVTPRIGAVLEERRMTLDNDLEKARSASSDATRIRADYESDLENARSEAAEFAKQAATESSKKAAAVEAKVAQKLANKVAKVEDKMAKAKSNAMDNLNDVAAEVAVEAIVALTGIRATTAHTNKAAASIATKLAKQEAN